ncbi:GntR family transcriptional regulator [Nocardioides sp. NPDC047086]|uniref:GntR family transcriptional regulator n=1 Tax=Nocardioides sp. NPDC047086 TaxID=3154810 RepID=UPI003404F373
MAAKFDRIAADLRHRIEASELQPGDRLPSETALLEEYGVSLGTLRRALDLLEAERHIQRVHGRGTFVRSRRTRLERSSTRYQWEKNRVGLSEEERLSEGASEKDTGLPLERFVFSARYEEAKADEDLADALGVEVGTPLLRRTYRTRVDDESAPFALVVSHLVVSHIEGNPRLMDESAEPWPGGTQHQLSTVGIEVERITDRVLARPATADEAREFDVAPGEALLVDRKTTFSTDGRVVEVADNKWPADRMALSFETTLEKASR